ncbi:MAG: transglutaminase-like domain-containing protein [Methylophilaceae bacterium]
MKQLRIHCELDYIASSDADYLFSIQAAYHPWQQILSENLSIEPFSPLTFGMGPTGQNRLAKMKGGPGKLRVIYDATVNVNYPIPTGQEGEMSIEQLPVEVIPYIWSSRYCESDAILQMASRTFGAFPKGYQRVEAICQWIRDNIVYQPGASTSTTSTMNVLVNRVGVCRDFAHLGITFCRALNIPARFVTGYTWYAEPPPDFHAIFEVYLGGRWILFDATQLAPVSDLVRIATGKDAADTSFATIFGPVKMTRMDPAVTLLTDSI